MRQIRLLECKCYFSFFLSINFFKYYYSLKDNVLRKLKVMRRGCKRYFYWVRMSNFVQNVVLSCSDICSNN